MSATATAPAIDVSALIARVERGSKITISDAAPRVAFGHAFVTTGTRPVGDQAEDVLVIVDGSSRVAFPAAAVYSAILGNVLPRDTVRALWAAADAAGSE